MAKAKKITFDQHYQQLFAERWESLRHALLQEVDYHCLDFGAEPYYLDRASYIAAEALGVRPGDRVLDMCAAPGGKSLVIAAALAGTGFLQCNDRSAARRQRLQRVLEQSLPPAWQGNLEISGHDGTNFGRYQPAAWDKILLDAPCSSERHVLQSPPHLAQWSPARAKNLAVQQYALLCSAVDALRPGGELIYSTCALDERENDQVIAKLLKKRAEQVQVVSYSSPLGEKTQYGWHILPDQSAGSGPIYFCKMRKKAKKP